MTNGAPRSTRVVFAIALALGLIPLFLVGSRLWKKSEWSSAPRRMPFVKLDGSVLPAGLSGPEECRSLDIHFKLLIDGSKVWIPCRNNQQQGALARMDLAAKRVDYRWPFPDWQVSWTEGLLPLPDGLLATVVRIDGGLGIAVAGPDGWLFPPKQVEIHQYDRVLGLSWNKGALDVAIGGIDTDRRPAWHARIVTLDGNGIRTRAFTACGEKCSQIHTAYFGSDSRWHFLVNQDYAPALLDMTEDGTTQRSNSDVQSFSQVDSTGSGVVTAIPSSKYLLGQSGKLDPRPPKPSWLRGEERLSYRFTRDGDHLSRLGMYEIDGKTLHSDPPALYSLTPEKDTAQSGEPGTPTWEDQTLGVRLFDVSTFELTPRKALTKVARTHECNDLGYTGALARVGKETVVFEPRGCYVTLDENLRRTDAWGVWDHLRMRGSMYLEWNERSHAVKLVWVVLAPLLVLGSFFARKKWPRSATAVSIVVALGAIWSSVSLWPILR